VRRVAPRPISQALDGLTATLAPTSTLARVQFCWEAVVGSAISTVARPTAEHDGVLTVLCESAVWAQELELLSPDLVGRLNEVLGAESLHKLRCRTG
jgi:predicted nucleic acid-binding Zn ribbon protein